MATLNFPDAPDTGDIYFDSNSGFTYEWNGTVWISRDPSTIPNIKELDNISGSFNGSTDTFNLTVSSVAVTPATAQQLLINIGNVLQNPGDDYTVSGSTITFTTAPISGLGFQGTLLGTGVSLGTVVDGTVDPSSLDISDSYNVGGITVTGITTVTDFKISGITTVANLEPSDINISGIGTVSNIIMTKDAAGLGATMGAAVGVVTYFGDGSNLTGLGLTFFPISYDPGISSTNIPTGTNITLDWNHPVKAGSGTITIREGSASGTVVDQFVVGTSSSISFVNNQVILDPAADLSTGVEYFVTYPAGSVKSYGDKYQNDQLIYSFTSKPTTIWGWGSNFAGQLGQNQAGGFPINYASSPVQLAGTWGFVTGGGNAALGVKNDGTLWVWGANAYGKLGLNSIKASPGGPANAGYSSPVQVGTDTTWSKESKHLSPDYSQLHIKTDGTLWSWGRNDWGQLGLNDRGPGGATSRSSPTQVGTETTWSDISGTYYEIVMAIKTDGTLWSWGNNYFSALGHNQSYDTTTPSVYGYSSPVQVGTDTTWSKVSAGTNVAYAIKTDGTLWGWGRNVTGELGLNSVTSPGNIGLSSPTQIGTDATWSAISKGRQSNYYGTAALKTDGTMWAWGGNGQGTLGQNSRTDYSSPVQVGTETTWSLMEMANGRIYGIKTNGTLWSWGYNNQGSLGHNTGGPSALLSSPTQVGTDTNWVSIRPATNTAWAQRS